MKSTGPEPTAHGEAADALAWALLAELIGWSPTSADVLPPHPPHAPTPPAEQGEDR
ncbi:hypothetical protein [Streptomyces sp. H51]|uniref:hypothetical protein n=1 Tax=Streptomyces sp. H51 TaxID=3111770 RepID=UPI002D77175C|nr:hypothetical protein [Streptomyces sp. H51]